eukprot:CAMPEP_0119313396 /NCGR_PEP_ID=MMETSP1333-20130426/28942_1 /TAXON_ID=418940 /ORGANISM="Scyphosphaera apsteinii, Strain RCC1455" /LENGTH=129 /DNA_ID=CAMNT_0007318223 /DNA_START=481 /DNA_END=870 /DNA_ORIENTATION=-
MSHHLANRARAAPEGTAAVFSVFNVGAVCAVLLVDFVAAANCIAEDSCKDTRRTEGNRAESEHEGVRGADDFVVFSLKLANMASDWVNPTVQHVQAIFLLVVLPREISVELEKASQSEEGGKKNRHKDT